MADEDDNNNDNNKSACKKAALRKRVNFTILYYIFFLELVVVSLQVYFLDKNDSREEDKGEVDTESD